MDEEKCDLCGKADEGVPEVWTTEDGEPVVIQNSVEASAVACTSRGELQICLECYTNRMGFESFTPGDLAAIHFQFGLEFLHRGEINRAKHCFEQSLEFKENSGAIAGIGCCYEEEGDAATAKMLWRKALDLDPECLTAQLNLQRFEEP